MPSTFLQALPTRAATAGALARQLLRLIGPGRQAQDGSLNAADALAYGSALAAARATQLGALGEAFVDTATDLLSEWEALLGIAVDTTLPVAARRARLLAFRRAATSGSPQSIEASVAAYAGSCSIVESSAVRVWRGDPFPVAAARRGVFRFTVVVPLGYVQSAAASAEVGRLVDRMKPAHTTYQIANAACFYTNGYLDSLTNCTALGD